MSAVGKSFSWNATDFGALGVFVTNAEEMFIPAPRVTETPLGGADGIITHGRTFGARRFTLECHLVATSRALRNSQMDDVVEALIETASGEKLFSRDNIPGKTWQARLSGTPIIGEKTDTTIDFVIEMVASNPWAAGERTTVLQAIFQTAQIFSFVGEGDQPSEKSEPVWIFKNGAVQVANVGLGIFSRLGIPQTNTSWANTLLANQWLRITRKTGIADTSLDGGVTWTTNNANMSGKIPLIIPGDNNRFFSFDFRTGTIQVTYTPIFR